MKELKVYLDDNAKLHTKGSKFSAGYDLYCQSNDDIIIKAQKEAPRSGLASKFSIYVGAGVVDEDYRGIIYVLLFNHGDKDFIVKKRDKIAQLIVEKIEIKFLIQVDKLSETVRAGFGYSKSKGEIN
ncbi:hypothetical protein HDU92_005795 [Lobulomyces angularis]|nr:hypothetical protein HDU92_005795 [Lobulomyces angularis]